MRLRHAMMSSALQQNATLLLSFATGVVIAHLLTPREVGSFSVALASLNVVAASKDVAIGSYVVSSPSLDDALLRVGFGLSLAIAACLSIVFWGLSFPLANLYQDAALGHALRIVAFAQLGPAIAFPATMLLMRQMRFGSLLVVGVAAAACQSAVSIGLAALGYGSAALAWGYFTSMVVTAAMTILYKFDTIRLRPTLVGSTRLLSFGGWISATHLVGSAGVSAPELMIGTTLGLANSALFSRAQNLVSFVRNGLFLGMTRPLLPTLAERESRGESLAPMYLRIVETITGLAWPAYAVLAIWAEPLVRTIYGDSWSAAGTMMVPIAIAHALTLAVTPHYDILIVKRRPRLLFASELSICVFTILALAIGIKVGVGAAVWSLVLSSGFFAIFYFFVLKAVVQFAPGALYRVWSRSLTLTFAAVPVPLAFRQLGLHGAGEVISAFAASGTISALIWVAAAVFIRHELSLHVVPLLTTAVAPRRDGG
jgi:O-antigen/teichoic acid export membrane protein